MNSQKFPQEQGTNHQDKLKIAVVGAKGLVGSWLSWLFKASGFSILETDLDTKDKNASVVRESDIIFIAVPLLETKQTLIGIADELTSDKFLVDFTSIKSNLAEIYSQLTCGVLSLHPMFAPLGSNFCDSSFNGEKLVVCNVKQHPVYTDKVLTVFKTANLKLVETTLEEHDKLMSLVQGVTHFNSLALLMTIKAAGFGVGETFDVSSPIYRMRLASACRIVMQDAALYHGIFSENPFLPQVLDIFEASIKSLRGLIEKKDLPSTKQLFEELRQELGEKGKEAFEETERLIRFMRE